MKASRVANKPMIIDADGLFVVSKNISIVSGYSKAILTPNVNEFRLLYKTMFGNCYCIMFIVSFRLLT